MKFTLTAVFQKVPEGYIGYVEELPGANTRGDTLEEARENLKEAVDAGIRSKPRACGRNACRCRCNPRAAVNDSRMKRRDLIRHLEAHHCEMLREGGNHTVYVNRARRKTTALPLHFRAIEKSTNFWRERFAEI